MIEECMDIGETTLRKYYPEVFAAANLPTGRPPVMDPTPEQRKMVQLASAGGMPLEDIGRLFGVSGNTIKNYFPEEIATGKATMDIKAIGELAKMMFSDIDSKHKFNAIKWYQTNRMGWRDNTSSENKHMGPNGEALAAPQSQVVLWLPDNGRGDSKLPTSTHDGRKSPLDPPKAIESGNPADKGN
jgi:hypothetical protein